MALLLREALTADNHALVRLFCCGYAGDWCRYADEWIKSGPESNRGAFASMSEWGTRVWLYFDDQTQRMVAFGSLGTNQLRWPTLKDERAPVAYIPQLAIDHNYHKKPDEPGTTKYCHQLMEDLIIEAIDTGRDKLVLHVAPTNVTAIGLYVDHGFETVSGYSDRYGNPMMLRRLA